MLAQCGARGTRTSCRSYFTRLRETATPIPGRKPKVFATAEEALSEVKSGWNIFSGGGCVTPTVMLKGLYNVAGTKQLERMKLHHLLMFGEMPWSAEGNHGRIRSNALFVIPQAKDANAGRADYNSVFLKDIPKLFYTKSIPIDAAIISVSPPDERGYCTIGPIAEIVRAGISMAPRIYAVVNPRIPRCFGEVVIHESHIDALIHHESELYAKAVSPPGETQQKIGKLIAENLVEDGATMQLGIGDVPDSVLACLKQHKNIGIHSEMVSDGVVDLIEEGVITNRMKSTHPGKCVVSFLYGSKRLYDYVHDNHLFHFGSCEWVNDPFYIARQSKMTSINSMIEMDLTGQVASDSIGQRIVSGFGGQVDFVTGASSAFDGKGKAIIACPSTNAKTGESKIVPFLREGAGVVTTRAHVQYVATEYGIANLFGRNYRQRAYDLIRLAHPNHREKLEKAAFERLKVMPSND